MFLFSVDDFLWSCVKIAYFNTKKTIFLAEFLFLVDDTMELGYLHCCFLDKPQSVTRFIEILSFSRNCHKYCLKGLNLSFIYWIYYLWIYQFCEIFVTALKIANNIEWNFFRKHNRSILSLIIDTKIEIHRNIPNT